MERHCPIIFWAALIVVAMFLQPTMAQQQQSMNNGSELAELLPEYTAKALEDPMSPQSRAYEWLMSHPNNTNLEDWRKLQLFALVTFFYEFRGDERWSDEEKKNYLNYNMSECEWGGRDDSSGTFVHPDYDYDYFDTTQSIRCSQDNRITVLWVDYLPLCDLEPPPTLPPELGLLTDLRKVGVQNSGIRGRLADFVPTELAHLTNLLELSVEQNSLTGAIFTDIARFSSLRIFNLTGNNLSGGILSEIGALKSLQVLSLRDTGIGGSIPEELFGLQNLTLMDLSNARLTGTLSEEFRLLNDSLMELFLDYNHLSGTIPEAFDYLTALETLHLEGNPSLNGSISPAVCSERGLRYQQLATLLVDCMVSCECCDNCLPPASPGQVWGLPSPAPCLAPTVSPTIAPSPGSTQSSASFFASRLSYHCVIVITLVWLAICNFY